MMRTCNTTQDVLPFAPPVCRGRGVTPLEIPLYFTPIRSILRILACRTLRGHTFTQLPYIHAQFERLLDSLS